MSSRRAFLSRVFRLPLEPAASLEKSAMPEGHPSSANLEESGPTPARLAAQLYGTAMRAVFGSDGGEPELPPDFTPAFLRIEAEKLGLDAGVPRGDLVRAVAMEMCAVRPPEASGGSEGGHAAVRRRPQPRRRRAFFFARRKRRGNPGKDREECGLRR